MTRGNERSAPAARRHCRLAKTTRVVAKPPVAQTVVYETLLVLPAGPSGAHSRSLVPELLHQLTLEHLARRAERERVHELDPARVLVFREVLLGVPRDLGPQFGVRDAGRRWVFHDHR